MFVLSCVAKCLQCKRGKGWGAAMGAAHPLFENKLVFVLGRHVFCGIIY